MVLTCGGSGGSGGSGFPSGGSDGGPVGGPDLLFGEFVGFPVVVVAMVDELDRAVFGRVVAGAERAASRGAVVEVGGHLGGERHPARVGHPATSGPSAVRAASTVATRRVIHPVTGTATALPSCR